MRGFDGKRRPALKATNLKFNNIRLRYVDGRMPREWRGTSDEVCDECVDKDESVDVVGFLQSQTSPHSGHTWGRSTRITATDAKHMMMDTDMRV